MLKKHKSKNITQEITDFKMDYARNFRSSMMAKEKN